MVPLFIGGEDHHGLGKDFHSSCSQPSSCIKMLALAERCHLLLLFVLEKKKKGAP
jgi:hypothetical protein